MDAERVVEVFAEASARAPGEQAAFLDVACAGDAPLRAEVASLLGCQDSAAGFLAEPALGAGVELLAQSAAASAGGELKAGEMLGGYRVLSLVGSGGMGEVYLAQDTALGRRVAVKLLRRGHGGSATARYFDHERRVLATLNHPHIARLYDSAATAEGRAYLVMEYVEGERLDTYCAARGLDLPGRLALFRKICAGVAYAHQRLVVHRDLKPANIRVTAEGEPKLLDFGIAKLLEAELPTDTDPDPAPTMQAMMTPDYASPEQLRGQPVTTASDIYSLGVILHELLTGQKPKVEGRGQKVEGRRMKAEGGGPALSSDLDNIVAMAMRGETERRYASATQFAEDIRRHVEGLPVIARKDTPAYRTRKFIGRNRAAVAAAALVALALVAGLAATTWEARRADRRFEDVRQLAKAIIFEVEPQLAVLPGATEARTTLIKRALTYLGGLEREAGGNRELRRELAEAYGKVGDVQGFPDNNNLGDFKGAQASYHKSLELRRQLVAEDPHDRLARHQLATTEEKLGYMLWWSDQTEAALALYHTALPLRQALLAEEPRSFVYRQGMVSLLINLGEVASGNARTAEALNDYQQALVILQALAREQPEDVERQRRLASCLSVMAEAQSRSGDYTAAADTYAQANGIFEGVIRATPDKMNGRIAYWYNLYSECENLISQKAAGKALALSPRVITMAESLAQPDPKNIGLQLNVATAHDCRGDACLLAGQWQEAAGEFQQGLTIYTRLAQQSPDNSDYHYSVGTCHLRIGQARLHLGQLDEAAADERQAREIIESAAGKDPANVQPRRDLVEVFIAQGEICERQPGKTAEARGWFQRATTDLEALIAQKTAGPKETEELAAMREKLAVAKPDDLR